MRNNVRYTRFPFSQREIVANPVFTPAATWPNSTNLPAHLSVQRPRDNIIHLPPPSAIFPGQSF